MSVGNQQAILENSHLLHSEKISTIADRVEAHESILLSLAEASDVARELEARGGYAIRI